MNEHVAKAFRMLDQLDKAIKQRAYDCDCQVGGVDAMSIDTDWLRHAAKEIRHGLRTASEIQETEWPPSTFHS